MPIYQNIKKAIDNIQNCYVGDDLAYLALTSKIELPIRDTIALQLHKTIHKSYMVSREWKRTDIGIITASDNNPAVLIELKAYYSSDMDPSEKAWEGHKARIRKDRLKSISLARENDATSITIYNILLATHPLSRIPKSLYGVVKYPGLINRSFKRHNDNPLSIEATARSEASIVFKGPKPPKYWRFSAGSAWGVGCDLLCWLYRCSVPA